MAEFEHAEQLIHSKATSLNQIAATFSKVAFKAGEANLDYGGGRFDKATELLAGMGTTNIVYDPFNRDETHNLLARLAVAKMGGAHTATINNVLNVVAEGGAIEQVIEQAANGLRPDGVAYFLIYEGDRSGVGSETSKGWQRNQKAAHYMEAIEKSFGTAKRKGNLIEARDPRPSMASLFDLELLTKELSSLAKKRGVPQPSTKHGVGKLIGGSLYVHRSAWDALPKAELARALVLMPKGFDPAIAKWEINTGAMSLIQCRGFDTEDEPAIQNSVKILPDGSMSLTKERADPQIYHHKWNFIRAGYEGFDRLESIIRSLSWSEAPCDKSRIGTRSFWESQVVWPLLAGKGAVGPAPESGSAPAPRNG